MEEEREAAATMRVIFDTLASPSFLAALHANATAVRAALLSALHLPAAAHVYLVPFPLYAVHGDFDEVLAKILLKGTCVYAT